MKVAVAGGTGVVGRRVVERLAADGHEAVVLSRSRGVDVEIGSGLEAALPGCDAVVDVSNVVTSRRRRSEEFFGATARQLQQAAARCGVGHVVVLSIVGIDRVDLGYYAGKRRQEQVLAEGPVPWSVLRATQFHEFAAQFLDRVPGPIAVVPRMLSRPVASQDVARALVDIVTAGPQGHAPEIAGPEDFRVADMARRVLRTVGSRRRVLELPVPGKVGRAAAGGGLLPQADHQVGQLRFEDYLASLTAS